MKFISAKLSSFQAGRWIAALSGGPVVAVSIVIIKDAGRFRERLEWVRHRSGLRNRACRED